MASRTMSRDELLGLPVAVELWPTAAAAFGMGRTQAYELAKCGEFPTPVLRLGNRYRVTRADLLRALGISEGEPAVEAGRHSASADEGSPSDRRGSHRAEGDAPARPAPRPAPRTPHRPGTQERHRP